MMRKTMTVGLVAAVSMALLFLVAPAHAQYAGCQAVVSDPTPAPGQTITVSGTGADPGTTVAATVNGAPIGSGTADSGGTFSFAATIPSDLAPGTYTVTINCGVGAGVLGVQITVGAVGVPGVPIPVTGSSSTIPLTKVALTFVAIGGLFVALSRSRRTSLQPVT